MKLRLSFFALGATLLLAGTLLTGCTQTNTPTTTDNRSRVVSSSTDTYIDVTGLSDNQLYEFTVAGSSSSTALKGFSSYQNGTIRVFWTRGAGDVSADTVYYRTATGSTASAGYYLWATAIRSTSTLRVFETADPTDPSGLILGPTAKTASISGSDKLNIDLVLATVNSLPAIPYLSIQSADVVGGVGTGGKIDNLSTARVVMGGLAMDNAIADVGSMIPSGTGRIKYIDILANTHDGSSWVFDVQTADNHYARVEIVPQPSGSTTAGYLWGDTGGSNSYRFIDVNVTYQPMTSTGYVSRPGITNRATSPTPR